MTPFREQLVSRYLQKEIPASWPEEAKAKEAESRASSLIRDLQDIVSRLEADASTRKDWPMANAYGELWTVIGT